MVIPHSSELQHAGGAPAAGGAVPATVHRGRQTASAVRKLKCAAIPVKRLITGPSVSGQVTCGQPVPRDDHGEKQKLRTHAGPVMFTGTAAEVWSNTVRLPDPATGVHGAKRPAGRYQEGNTAFTLTSPLLNSGRGSAYLNAPPGGPVADCPRCRVPVWLTESDTRAREKLRTCHATARCAERLLPWSGAVIAPYLAGE